MQKGSRDMPAVTPFQKQKIRIEIPSADVELGGRTFALTEMSGKRLGEYFEIRATAEIDVRAAVKDKSPERLNEALQKAADADRALFTLILGAYDDAWAEAYLTPYTKSQILAVQDDLNRTEQFLGNLQNLLASADETPAAAE